jgi:hypothetical protein
MKALTLLAVLAAALCAAEAHAELICVESAPGQSYVCDESEPSFDGQYTWSVNDGDGDLRLIAPNAVVFVCSPSRGGFITVRVEISRFGIEPEPHSVVVFCNDPVPPPPAEILECVKTPSGECMLAEQCVTRDESAPASRYRGVLRGARGSKGDSSTRFFGFNGRGIGSDTGGGGGRGFDVGVVHGMEGGVEVVFDRRRGRSC